jgi:hypothetical protein
MRNDNGTLVRRVGIILCAAGLLSLAGCGSNFPKLYPVTGKVTLSDGKPLTAGAVAFHPDSSKGNTAPVDCVSAIDSQGHFELVTRGVKGADSGRGAPLGWYKVILVANPRGGKLPEINVNPRYLKAETTPLLVEVTADAKSDVYDLRIAP